MEYIKKVLRNMRNGGIREVWKETCWIYRYAKRYTWKIILYIVLGLLVTSIGLLSSLLSRQIINLVVAGLNQSSALLNAIPIIVLFVALVFLRVGLHAANSRITAKVSLQVNREMRADTFQKFMNTGWQSISNYHSGDLLNRIHNDVSTVASSVLGWIPSLITYLAQFVGALIVITHFDPTMALIALAGIPITSMVFILLAPKLRVHNRKVLEASSDLTAFYADSLQNIQSVKSFGAVDAFCEELEGLQEKHIDCSLEQNKFTIRASVCMSLAGIVVSYLCMGWGIYRLWCGKIDFGTMVLFLQLANYLSAAASGLIKLGPSVISATVSAKRIMSILDLPRENVEESPKEKALREDPAGVSVLLEHVDFDYRSDLPVLQNVNFSAKPGEVVAIVGPSGTGKTTLLRLLLCLVMPKSGRAVLEGEHTGIVPLNPSLRRLFSYVPQDRALFSGTIAQTLRLAKPEASEEELWEALRLADMEQAIRSLPEGLNSDIGQAGSKFSAGQCQRISIARALLHEAPILLLDEATSALDVTTERRILRTIMSHCKNKTCIVTTHRPSVLSMCDHVYEIQNHTVRLMDEESIERLRKEF